MTISEDMRFWVELLSVIGGMLGFVTSSLVWLVRQSLVTHQGLSAALAPMGEQLDDHGERITKIEGSVADLPTHREWSDMRERLVRVEEGQNTIKETVTGVKEVLERIERPLNVMIDFQLKGGK